MSFQGKIYAVYTDSPNLMSILWSFSPEESLFEKRHKGV
jgi:hypothetical protein